MRALYLSLLILCGCSPAPEIQYTQLAKTPSPSGEHDLIIARQDPGALGSLSTAVFVRVKGDSSMGERVFVVKGEQNVNGEWLTATQVHITYTEEGDGVFTRKDASGVVKIDYAKR